MQYQDTIFALSSGALPSGVAMIRVSGNDAASAAVALAGVLPESRRATLRTIRSRNGLTLDRGLVLYSAAPNSFTGEDCLELHIHGGKAVAKSVLAALAEIPNLRQAEAGEFSRRAFENGKLDLVEVEGLSDLLMAETEMQRRLAIEQAAGGLSSLYESWATRITKGRAFIEAELDFADEDDVPGSVSNQVWADMELLLAEMRRTIDGAGVAELIRDGFRVVIAGPPNAGKSSLLNALTNRDAAIVTPIPGTTRDVLQVDLDLRGYAVRLFDTAGLRESSDPVEIEGVRRARRIAETADLILWLSSGDAGDMTSPIGPNVVRISSKSDLTTLPLNDAMAISTVTHDGLDELVDTIVAAIEARTGSSGTSQFVRDRHVENLRHCIGYLESAIGSEDGLDLRAEHLRLAGDMLGRITGRVGTEDLLGVIFSTFCIGK